MTDEPSDVEVMASRMHDLKDRWAEKYPGAERLWNDQARDLILWVEAGRRAAPATVTREQIARTIYESLPWAASVPPCMWGQLRSDHRRTFERQADAIMALLPATVTPSRDDWEYARRYDNYGSPSYSRQHDLIAGVKIDAPDGHRADGSAYRNYTLVRRHPAGSWEAAPPASTTTEPTIAG